MPTNDEMEKRAEAFWAAIDNDKIRIRHLTEFARAEIARLDLQEDYLNSKIEAATETWKDVDTDDFMNELRGSDDDKAREEAKEAAHGFDTDIELFDSLFGEFQTELGERFYLLAERGQTFCEAIRRHAGVAVAEPRWTAVNQLLSNSKSIELMGVSGTRIYLMDFGYAPIDWEGNNLFYDQRYYKTILEAWLEYSKLCHCKSCEINAINCIEPHKSDCAVHNLPAMPNGDCSCQKEVS